MVNLAEVPFRIKEKYGANHTVFIQKINRTEFSINVTEYLRKSNGAGNFFKSFGLKNQDRVLSILFNSHEWFCLEMGVFFCNGIHVPVSIVASSQQIEHIAKVTAPVLIIVNSFSKQKQVSEIVARLGLATTIINLKERDILNVLSDGEVITMPDPQDIAVILFTSGSTDSPKGVALTHRNIITALSEFSELDIFDKCNRALSFLPFNFSGERKLNYSYMLRGIQICFPVRTQTATEAIDFFKPSITAVVPYLLETIIGQPNKNIINLRVVCGGGPLRKELGNRFENAGGELIEVYGLTETASLLSYNTLKYRRQGTVGKPAKSVKIKITAEGELWMQGENLMKGYWVNNEYIETGLNEEGWFQTNDVVRIDEDGFLTIEGRIGNRFKNSKGEFVYIDAIEKELSELLQTPFIWVFYKNPGFLNAILMFTVKVNDVEVQNLLQKYNEQKDAYLKIQSFAIIPQGRLVINDGFPKYNREAVIDQFKKQSFFCLF